MSTRRTSKCHAARVSLANSLTSEMNKMSRTLLTLVECGRKKIHKIISNTSAVECEFGEYRVDTSPFFASCVIHWSARFRTDWCCQGEEKIVSPTIFFSNFYFPSSGQQAVVTGVVPLLPPGSCLRFLSRIGFSNQSHPARRLFIECC